MSRVWLVTKHHFLQEARKRSFLILLFALPLFLALTIGLGYLAASLDKEKAVVGYVDEAGIIVETLPPPEGEEIHLASYPDVDSARTALDKGEIDAYYLIGSTYDASGEATLVYHEPLYWPARRYFRDVVQFNLASGQDPQIAERLMEEPQLTVRVLNGNREFRGGPGAGLFLPLAVAVILTFLIMTTSGYMAEVVVEEKANRTIELIITSVSTGQMMAGKILGGVLIAVLQLAVWLSCLLGAIWLGANVFDVSWLASLEPNWRDVLLLALVGAPSYLLVAGLMTMVGSMMSDTYDSQQASGFSIIIFFLPVYVLVPIIQNPTGTLAVLLSIIPGTSLFTLAMRSIIVEVPVWQYITSAGVASLLALLVVWMAGKAFRISMLRYGKRLSLKELAGLRNATAGQNPAFE